MITPLRFDPRRTARLRAIADALGVPVEALFSDPQPAVDEDLLALLRLWGAITDPQGRRRVLTCVRHEAARCGHRDAEG